MRSTRAAHAAIAALGVVLLVPATAAADGKGKRPLRVVATVAQQQFLDLGTPGPSLGDQVVFSEVLRERGREVGTSGGACTATEVTGPYAVMTFQCVVTLWLRGGQITLQGLVELQGMDDPGPNTIAITGGTGKYVGAAGEARIRRVSPRRLVYRLRFDDGKKHRHHHHHHHH